MSALPQPPADSSDTQWPKWMGSVNRCATCGNVEYTGLLAIGSTLARLLVLMPVWITVFGIIYFLLD